MVNVRRCEGYVSGDTREDPEGVVHLVEFYSTDPPMRVPIAESVLKNAGAVLEDGGIVVADIDTDAETPEEVNPTNLEAGGKLPDLNTEFMLGR